MCRGKYERAMKELEYSKKRLAQQHEDDLEQLLALKKQLEKKVSRTRVTRKRTIEQNRDTSENQRNT